MFGGAWGPGVPAVVALHGWRRTHDDFAPVFAPLFEAGGSAQATSAATPPTPPPTAIGLDLFGFGATPAPEEPWGSEQYARALVPLFEEPGTLADRVVVVGHSFGGRVALHLATMVPDRIERMVLTGVPMLDREGRRSTPALPFRIGRRLHRMGLVGDERMERLRNKYGSADYRAAAGVMRGVFVTLLTENYEEQIAAIGCPVDLVWGELDTEVPVEVAERARGMFASAALTVLPGVGHLTPTEAPDALRRIIVDGTA